MLYIEKLREAAVCSSHPSDEARQENASGVQHPTTFRHCSMQRWIYLQHACVWPAWYHHDTLREERIKSEKNIHYFPWLLYASIKSDRMKHWVIIKQYAAAAMWKCDTALWDLRASLSWKQSGPTAKYTLLVLKDLVVVSWKVLIRRCSDTRRH